MATEEWKLLCVVRGYHAYKDVWDPVLEDQFRTKHQYKSVLCKMHINLKSATILQWPGDKSIHST